MAKVLLVNKFLYPKGGSERVMFELAHRFSKLGHDVAFWGMMPDKNVRDVLDVKTRFQKYLLPNIDYSQVKGIEKLKTALNFVYNLQAKKLFGKVLDEYKPDYVHYHNIYHQLTPAIFFESHKRGIPSTLVLHDYKLVCPRYNFIKEDGTPCNRCAETLQFMKTMKEENCCRGAERVLLAVEANFHLWLKSYDRVDLFVSPSSFLKKQLIRKRFSKNPGVIKVVYNRVDTDVFSPTWEDEGYILYLGRMVPEKGVEDLVKAYASAYKRGWTSMPLVFVGEGPLRKTIEQRYGELPIVCKGYMTGKNLIETVRKSSYVVLPSRCYENCPMSVIEALACGKPAVVRNRGGAPELVEHGQTGLLFENNNELMHAIASLEDVNLRREMAKRAREEAMVRFSLKDVQLEDYTPR